MSVFAAVTPFGVAPVPRGIDVVGFPATVGTLTAYDARPETELRGTALFIPGFTGSKEDFRTFIPLLNARGWRVVAYSQRGQADSAAPLGVDNYGLNDFAADAIEVVRLVGNGDPMHILGHSFGGIVAQAAVLTAPGMFRSLTLLCSGPHGWPGRHEDTARIVREAGSIGLWERDNPGGIELSDAELGAEAAFFRQRARATSSDNLLAGAQILRDQADVTEQLRGTGVPAHIAHGELDDKWPIADQRDMARRLGARYTVIEGGAHSPQLEAPEATATGLHDFWASIA